MKAGEMISHLISQNIMFWKKEYLKEFPMNRYIIENIQSILNP